MKKQNISVELHLMGNEGGLAPASAYDQLLAHRDIVYNYIPGEGDENAPAKYIYPYHAVNYAVITRESETVEAPTDAICGGGEAGTLELTPTTVGNKSITYFPTEGILPCSFSIFDVPTYFDGLIYNGNEVDIYTAKADPSFSYTVKDGVYNSEYASWYIPHECGDTSIHAGDKKDVEFTVKYKGATATAVVECTITVSQ